MQTKGEGWPQAAKLHCASVKELYVGQRLGFRVQGLRNSRSCFKAEGLGFREGQKAVSYEKGIAKIAAAREV